MIAAGWNVVLTHGNGPQVGFILRRSEIADGQVPTVPVQYAVGDTQGAIGFMFQNALGNALLKRAASTMPVVTLVTQTLVDRRDPAFAQARQADRLVHDRGGRAPASPPSSAGR